MLVGHVRCKPHSHGAANGRKLTSSRIEIKDNNLLSCRIGDEIPRIVNEVVNEDWGVYIVDVDSPAGIAHTGAFKKSWAACEQSYQITYLGQCN